MRKKVFGLSILFAIFMNSLFSCTNYIVTKGASKDGSAFLAYTIDAPNHIFHLYKKAAQDHNTNEKLSFVSRNGISGEIDKIEHTYATLGFHINEYQLAIGETTFGGRRELMNKDKFLEYWHLLALVLERAKSAREGITILTDLVEKYGYASEGETFSLVDPNEAWIVEMSGEGNGGVVWVAVKIPDGYVCPHSNMSIIDTFPLNDPEKCMYSDNVISFAIEKGYYNPETGKPFSFREAYCPVKTQKLIFSTTRTWRLLSQSAPSLNLSADYCRGKSSAEPYPAWIKPDNKVTLKDVLNIMRDHYEGLDFDLCKGIDAGAYGNPHYDGPPIFMVDSVKYFRERPISVNYTAVFLVSQCRSFLTDEIGGVLWYGTDNSYFTCNPPLYCGISEVPECFKIGDVNKFSWNSAWWVFNFVSNYANIKYSYMVKDIQCLQSELEDKFIAQQDSVECIAMKLLKDDRTKGVDFLTDYSSNCTKNVMEKWTELAYNLIINYNDGYVPLENGKRKRKGYSDEWKRKIIESDIEKDFRLK